MLVTVPVALPLEITGIFIYCIFSVVADFPSNGLCAHHYLTITVGF